MKVEYFVLVFDAKTDTCIGKINAGSSLINAELIADMEQPGEYTQITERWTCTDGSDTDYQKGGKFDLV